MVKKESKKSKNKKKNTKKEQFNNDTFMFSMLLSVTCMLLVALKPYHFTLFSHSLTFSLLIIPIVIFISNYITKKYNFQNSFMSIIISTLMMIAFLLLVTNLTNKPVKLIEILGDPICYFISMFINLAIYYYILTNISTKSSMIIINYLFTMLLYTFLCIIFFNNIVLTNNFWTELLICSIIQFFISLILVYFDMKIERGIAKEK